MRVEKDETPMAWCPKCSEKIGGTNLSSYRVYYKGHYIPGSICYPSNDEFTEVWEKACDRCLQIVIDYALKVELHILF